MKVSRKGGDPVPVRDTPYGSVFEFDREAYARVNRGIHRLGDADDVWGVRLADGLLTLFGPGVSVAPVEGEFVEQ